MKFRLTDRLKPVPTGAFILVAIAFIAVLSASAASAQTTITGRETSAESVARYALTENMPVDPEAALGTLPNGLRYYVRRNARPARRAELRLVVKAGSVLEDDDQRGLAHFVEHMLFEGTEHFPGQALVGFLSALGLSIGPDANAATSFDDTQYTLRVPTDMPGALDRALLVLEDWAQAASFDQAGIDKERGIVLSEWRMHLGASERTRDKIHRAELQGSRYEDRMPIGDPTTIERATREQLLRFYRDWYRPDLMAVIVVGDIDRDEVVRIISSRFSALRAPQPARPRQQFSVPEQPATRFAVVSDKESTATAVQVTTLRPARNQGSIGGYRDIMRDQLFADMFGARLTELAQTANPPFLQVDVDRSLFPAPRTLDETSLQALVANDGVTRGLDAMLTELQRVVRFGFTASELTRAKETRMRGYERMAQESPDRESASRADEYTRNFLQNEALPTIWQELAFHRRFLPGITLQEVSALAEDWFPDRNRLVVIMAPEAAGVVIPDQAQLTATVRGIAGKRLEPYVDSVAGRAMLDAPPRPGTIVRTTARADLGVTEWTLSNGATVVLKPTTLKEDQILFRATASGGTSIATDAQFPAAKSADDVIPAGGAAAFSDVALDKLNAGKAMVVRPFINEVEQGMAGGSTPQDLESMFQLLYLRFTQPRADQNAFAAMSSQARALLANRNASPEFVFNQTIESALSQNHPRRQPDTPSTVDQWNLAESLAFYKARFADASRFTFVFVGSFTVEMIKPFVETYIASLPATRGRETFRDLGIKAPTGVIEKVVQKGLAPKSQVAIVFSGPFQFNDANVLALRTTALLLQARLFDAIRGELGGTYSITATPEAEKFPQPQFSIRIEWTCDPARTDMLVKRVFEEIESLRATRFSGSQMAYLRQGLLREYEQNSEDNAYLLNQLARRYRNGEVSELSNPDEPSRINALTADALQQAAQLYLDTKNYVKVTLIPETSR